MMIKGLIMYTLMKRKGIFFIDFVRSSRYSNVFYCVDRCTGLYSFWSVSKGLLNVALLSSGLTRMDAEFKLSIMGG